jgi:hypothetical protein
LPNAEPRRDEALHELVEGKLSKVFGADRGPELLRGLLTELRLPAIETTDQLVRVADLLQTRQGFERTAGAMLSVMAAVRRSAGR